MLSWEFPPSSTGGTAAHVDGLARAMRRAGLRRIRRSLAYAASHLQDGEREEAADALHAHPSGQDPDVAEALGWLRRCKMDQP